MKGNNSKSHLFGRAASSSSERVVQARQLLTLLKETERSLRCNPDTALNCLNRAMALLAVDNQSEPSPRKHKGGLARWQIARVDGFISEHIHHCIRMTELASLLGLSASHFSHAFKQTTGMTPLMYVAAKRVEAAAQYMLCSAHSLSDIALRLGFCDQSHFCRVFRRETGLSPQTWRKLNTTGPNSHAVLKTSSFHQVVQIRSRS